MFEGEPPTYGEHVGARFALRRSTLDYARDIDNILGTGSINRAVDFAIKLTRYLLEKDQEKSNILIEKLDGSVSQLAIRTVASDIERWLQNPE